MDDAAPFGTYAPHGLVRWAVETARKLPDSWAARRLVILLRRVATGRLRGAPVDVEALGARMRLHPYNNICEKKMLFTPATFDSEELGILAARLRDGFVFIDVGANIGAYSLFVAARTGPSARILAVEPQPHVYDRLVRNIRLNQFATIKAIDCAVADKTGDLTLFLDTRNSGESSVKVVTSGGAAGIRVSAKTLLSLVQEEGFQRIDAMKLDVEGAEDLILEPFFAEAPDELHPSLLIVEDGSPQWQVDVPGLLQRHGYRLLAKTRLNYVFDRGQPAA
ncbi:MAG TPA: FkbM family methyltransferase [Enterovirga sp.]